MATHRQNQRGVALIMVALFMVVILGFTVLGIDIARLAHVASEVQSVADAAARGGAKALMDTGGTPGVGITRAQEIAAENVMNGHAADPNVAPEQVVAVDEGHWVVDDPDTGEGHFACCTNNTPCCQGGSALGCSGPGTLSCASRSAVLAEPRTTVDNLLAGIFNFIDGGRIATAAPTQGAEQTQVQKLAIAGPSGPAFGCVAPEGTNCGSNFGCMCDAGVPPCLPITVASCEFVPPNCSGVGCSLPTITVSSDKVDTAGWTGFQDGHNTPNIEQYLKQGPCPSRGNKSPNEIPEQQVGGDIDITNGINSGATDQPFDLVKCLAGQKPSPQNQPQGCAIDPSTGQILSGQRGAVFQIPVFDAQSSTCDPKFTDHSAPVVGFATVEVVSVTTGPNPSLTFKVIHNATATQQQVGGGCFGTDCRVTMTR